MNDSNSLLKGSLSAIILKLLSIHGHMYGYEICQHVKGLTNGQMRITEGAIYPSLHKLESEGLLISFTEIVEGRNRKYYAVAPGQEGLTESRLNLLQEFIGQLQLILNPTSLLKPTDQ